MDNELMHYGKIGMKWGRRRAARLAQRDKLVESATSYQLALAKARTKFTNTKMSKYSDNPPKTKEEYKATVKEARALLKDTKNKEITKYRRDNQVAIFGKGGDKRIKANIEKGMSEQDAHRREIARRVAIVTVGYLAINGATQYAVNR